MTALERLRLRTAEYHDRARDASALAEASVLHQVREKHQAAAARWTELALMTEAAEMRTSVRAHSTETAPYVERLVEGRTSCTI